MRLLHLDHVVIRRWDRRDPLRTALAAIGFVAGAAVLALAVRPAPRYSPGAHWQAFGVYASAAAALLFAAAARCGRGRRLPALVLSILLIAFAALAHPVCVPIPVAERAAFETVSTLRERAARGEPFCELGGEWYQCKSTIARAFFF